MQQAVERYTEQFVENTCISKQRGKLKKSAAGCNKNKSRLSEYSGHDLDKLESMNKSHKKSLKKMTMKTDSVDSLSISVQ